VAVASAPTTRRHSDVIDSARRRLEVLERAGAVALFGAGAREWTDGLTAQRIDIEDIAAVRGRAVALMVQRGRDHGGLWVERRISAVFSDDAEPILHGSWVDGLDSASRA